jgi:hypothetical protein
MSADNGVYILQTSSPDGNGFEYRVAHLQAVDNVYAKRCQIHGSDLRLGNDGRQGCVQCQDASCEEGDEKDAIANAREMWARSQVYVNELDALQKARAIYDNLDICEYGISFVEIPLVF